MPSETCDNPPSWTECLAPAGLSGVTRNIQSFHMAHMSRSRDLLALWKDEGAAEGNVEADMESYFYFNAGLGVACPLPRSPTPLAVQLGRVRVGPSRILPRQPCVRMAMSMAAVRAAGSGRSFRAKCEAAAPHRTALHCTAAQRSVQPGRFADARLTRCAYVINYSWTRRA